MPDISIETYFRHCTDKNVPRQTEEWRSLGAARLVKGENFNFTFQFKIGAMTAPVTNRDRKPFLGEMCKLAAVRVLQKYGRNVCIVPIPNSDGTVASPKPFATLVMARAIATALGPPSDATDAIRWKSNPGKAHKNERARDVENHIYNMKLMRRPAQKVVLFDDVVTTGSQLFAAKELLEAANVDVAGMLTFVEVVGMGSRSDMPTWRTTTRTLFRAADLFD